MISSHFHQGRKNKGVPLCIFMNGNEFKGKKQDGDIGVDLDCTLSFSFLCYSYSDRRTFGCFCISFIHLFCASLWLEGFLCILQ